MTIIRSNTTAGLRIEPDNAGNIVFITGTGNVAMRMEPSGLVNIATSRFVVPVGNTAQRPGNAVAGSLRFNNSSNVFEAFTNTGWANVSTFVRPPINANVEYLVVAGGGGGGGAVGGGGGAGGSLLGNASITSGNVYTVTIGAGGPAGSAPLTTAGGSGTNSVFSTFTATGGGGGGAYQTNNGLNGGSGGGAGGLTTRGTGTPGQGNDGGTAPGGGFGAGGGGGASQVGTNGSGVTSGKGGDGIPSLITGANVIYGGGGGGGGRTDGPSPNGGAGGAGGGGAGGKGGAGNAGSENTGGGGGAGGFTGSVQAGAAGGSGIVILAHANTISNAIVSAGLTYTLSTISRPGFLVYSFTAGTGTINWI